MTTREHSSARARPGFIRPVTPLWPPSHERALRHVSSLRRDIFRILIEDQCRISFRWTNAGPEDVKIVDYH